jgi:hypothetical protein
MIGNTELQTTREAQPYFEFTLQILADNRRLANFNILRPDWLQYFSGVESMDNGKRSNGQGAKCGG